MFASSALSPSQDPAATWTGAAEALDCASARQLFLAESRAPDPTWRRLLPMGIWLCLGDDRTNTLGMPAWQSLVCRVRTRRDPEGFSATYNAFADCGVPITRT